MKKQILQFTLTCFISLCLGVSSIIFAQTFPAGYVHEKIAPIELPTGISFTPDGRPVVLNSVGGKGTATIVNADGSTTPFFTVLKTYTNKEKGLLGLAFDPDFVSNGYVYFYYTADLSPSGNQSRTCQNTIARITAKNYIADMSTMVVLLKLFENPTFIVQPNHDGGTLAFGPDGKLYVASGDMDLWCGQLCISGPNATGCNCGAVWKAPTYAQDTSGYLGKILRINKDGSAPTDNPFYKAGATDARNYIFTLGLRNPYTMHFKKGTSQLWINDVGSSNANKREEINMIDVSNPSSTKDKNLGYNNGNLNPIDFTPPSTEGFFDKNNSNFATYTQPVQVYLPSEGCAISGGVFYEPSKPSFEAKYVGKYFFMDFCQGWIKYMNADGTGVTNFATGLAGGGNGFGSVAIEEGPDGHMYHLVRSVSAGVSGLYRIKGPNAVGVEAEIVSNKYAFSVHPNPSNGGKMNVHYNAKVAEIATIEIFDQMGKLNKTFQLSGNEGFNDENLDISSLNRGVYVVKFSTPNAKAAKKLVVE